MVSPVRDLFHQLVQNESSLQATLDAYLFRGLGDRAIDLGHHEPGLGDLVALRGRAFGTARRHPLEVAPPLRDRGGLSCEYFARLWAD